MVHISDNGARIMVRMLPHHDMPKVICIKQRVAVGEDIEVWFEPREVSEALARLLAKARAKSE